MTELLLLSKYTESISKSIKLWIFRETETKMFQHNKMVQGKWWKSKQGAACKIYVTQRRNQLPWNGMLAENAFFCKM